MFLIGTVLAQSNIDNLWTPPLLGHAGGGTRGVAGLIGLGILLTVPSVANAVKEALKAKAAPVGLGAALGPMGAGGMQALTILYQLKFLKSEKPKPPAPAPGSTPIERSMEAARGPKA
jgi:hypothetical protein